MAQNSAASVIASALDDLPGELRRAVIKEFQTGIQKDWVKAGIDMTQGRLTRWHSVSMWNHIAKL
jgi:hypothetical protein